jgi:hypothetical protein
MRAKMYTPLLLDFKVQALIHPIVLVFGFRCEFVIPVVPSSEQMPQVTRP